MKRLASMLVAFLAVVTTAACGSSTTETTPTCNYTSQFMQDLQGSWSQCAPAQTGIGFAKTTLTVSCLNVTFTNTTYTDAACTTQTNPPVVVSAPATLTIGTAVPNTTWVGAPLPAVTAYPLAISVPTLTMSIYTLGYIDTAATPDNLYVGAFNPALPYPTQLYPVFPFVKQ